MTHLLWAVVPTQLEDLTPHRPVLAEAITDSATGVWIRDGYGVIGFGSIARHEAYGPQRFEQLRDWWSDIAATAEPVIIPAIPEKAADAVVDTNAGAHAAGASEYHDYSPHIRAFTALTFDDRSEVASVGIVPEILLIHDQAGTRVVWQLDAEDPVVTGRRIGGWAPSNEEVLDRLAEFLDNGSLAAEDSDAQPLGGAAIPEVPARIHPDEAHISPEQYVQLVQAGLDRIEAGELTKVVAARDEVLSSPQGIDVAATLKELNSVYRRSWTYRVGDLIGSTPELLIARKKGEATARVLAGTVDREALTEGTSEEEFLDAELVNNTKQRFEHQTSVDSLLDSIAHWTKSVRADEQPFVLQLPNVWHLATDVSVSLNEDVSVLDLVEAINPTAAVGGAPQADALDAIYEMEFSGYGMDRGLYAGPVGWLDGNHDGEFGIALRGGVLEDHNTIRIYAGCGIVDGSVPQDELAETHAKLRPMLTCLRIVLPDSNQLS